MKKIIAFIGISFFLFSFTNYDGQRKVTIKSSTINWKGFKVGSDHQGNVSLKEGYFYFDKDKIVGGAFTVDMTTISCSDLKGGWKDKLIKHLNSNDFFSVETHPTASLVIKSAKYLGGRKYQAKGELTIKDTKKPIDFKIKQSDKGVIFITLKINRIEYGIKYNSGSFFENLGDKLIKDEFEVNGEFTL